jgi:hypothetical protein
MKKFWMMLAVAGLFATTVVSCGEKKEEATEETTEEAPAESEEAPVEEAPVDEAPADSTATPAE